MGGFFSKENIKRCALAVLLAALVAAAGGCGGGDGGTDGASRAKLYVAGELHGGLAEALSSLVYCAPYCGQTDAPLLISYEDGKGMDEQTAEDALRVFEAGYAVGIEHATETEVNDFLEDMGLERSFVMPENGESEDGAQMPQYEYVEFFGIKTIDGDVLSYTALVAEEPEILNEEPETIYVSVPKDEWNYEGHTVPTSADITDVTGDTVCVAVSMDHYLEEHAVPESTAEDLQEMEERGAELDDYGWKLEKNGDGTFTVVDGEGNMVTSADLAEKNIEIPDFDRDTIFEDTVTAEDEAELDRVMAENIIEWLFSTDMQAAEIAAQKSSVSNSLNASNATGGDLKQILKMYQKTFDASIDRQEFKIFVDVYACHTYNAAASGTEDVRDSDWFFIKQTAQLNPSGNYVNDSTGKSLAVVEGYMVSYEFNNWPVDAEGEKYTTGVTLRQPKPDSTIGTTSSGESTSFSFGGNLGFCGFSGSGGLSFGGSYSYDQSTTVPECQVDNRSQTNSDPANARWLYSFSRPQTTGHPFYGFNKFKDAPLAARSMFQPENQWTWQLDETARSNVKGFKFDFTWTNGYSYGEAFLLWIKVDGVWHRDWLTKTTTFYVPFDAIMPPLIVANDVDFSAQAQSRRIQVGTSRPWHAQVVEGGSWCSVDDRRIDTNGGDNSIVVEVAQNTTGASRTATVTLTTDDGKGSYDVKIYQARY